MLVWPVGELAHAGERGNHIEIHWMSKAKVDGLARTKATLDSGGRTAKVPYLKFDALILYRFHVEADG